MNQEPVILIELWWGGGLHGLKDRIAELLEIKTPIGGREATPSQWPCKYRASANPLASAKNRQDVAVQQISRYIACDSLTMIP